MGGKLKEIQMKVTTARREAAQLKASGQDATAQDAILAEAGVCVCCCCLTICCCCLMTCFCVPAEGRVALMAPICDGDRPLIRDFFVKVRNFIGFIDGPLKEKVNCRVCARPAPPCVDGCELTLRFIAAGHVLGGEGRRR
jgi:hypothetical protein